MEQAHTDPRVAIVVEDDGEVRALAATLLEESDFAVVECDSAEAALRAAQQSSDRIALIFTDVRLAGEMDGVELARIVHERWPDVSVLVTSGIAGDRAQHLPKEARYMAKPWRALDVLTFAERARRAH
jgi:DNA-binding NtrC family response regulator